MMVNWYLGAFLPLDLYYGNREASREEICFRCRNRNPLGIGAPLRCVMCICHKNHQHQWKELHEQWAEQAKKWDMNKEKEMSSKMPKLKPGDLIKTTYGAYWWIFDDKWAYYIQPSGEGLAIDSKTPLQELQRDVEEIWRHVQDSCMSVTAMSAVIAGEEFPGMGVQVLWKKPEKAVEMTMSQLKEKLGYPVKIVGEKHA